MPPAQQSPTARLPRLDHLDQLQSLNRLFLHELKRRYRDGLDCLGLPRAALAALGAADEALLDTAARFPRALFSLSFTDRSVAEPLPVEARPAERGLQALKLTLVHSAWNVCIYSEYRARVLFGLAPEAIRRLCVTTLFELPQTALGASVRASGFGGAVWLWRSLLSSADEPTRQRLGLVVLQPASEVEPAVDEGLRRSATA